MSRKLACSLRTAVGPHGLYTEGIHDVSGSVVRSDAVEEVGVDILHPPRY